MGRRGLAHHAHVFFLKLPLTVRDFLPSLLFLRPRLRRATSPGGVPVRHHKLPELLPGMLDHPLSQVAHTVFEPWSASHVHASFIPLSPVALDDVRAGLQQHCFT